MQRSGTSALSGALHRLGVDFGTDELLYPADANNPKGFFEHRKATILNLRCLDAFLMHPTSLDRMPTNWKEHPQAESLRSELKSFIREEFSKAGRWGIKQPLTSLVLPLYGDVFQEIGITPQYVLCVRNPIEAMNSESKLDFGKSYRVMPSLGKRAIGSWLRYTLGSVADSVGHPLSVVDYDRLLADPRGSLEFVVNRDVNWSPTADQWTSAIGSIHSDLRHNRSSVEELEGFPSIVRRTFDSVREFADTDPNTWNKLLSLHAEFEMWRKILGEPAPPAGKLGLAWVADGQRHIAEAPYVPTRSWQSVRVRIGAPPKTRISGLIYGLPCRVWIRRSIWHRASGDAPAPITCGLGSTLSYANGVTCLDAVFEPDQIQLSTPGGNGPFELELEFLLEVGPSISAEASARLARQLEQCVAAVDQLSARVRG